MQTKIWAPLCLLGVLAAATPVMAGGYGDVVEPEELPVAPPAPAPAPAPPPPPPAAPAGPDYGRVGPYIGAGFVYAVEDFDIDENSSGFSRGPGSSSSLNFDDSLGYNLRAGYRVHPNVAIEGLFEHYVEFEADINGFGRGADTLTVEAEGLAGFANAKFFALTDALQPYASVGVGALNGEVEVAGLSTDETEFAARFGGGVDAYVTENVYFNIEAAYVLPTGDLDDFGIIPISGGLGYRF